MTCVMNSQALAAAVSAASVSVDAKTSRKEEKLATRRIAFFSEDSKRGGFSENLRAKSQVAYRRAAGRLRVVVAGVDLGTTNSAEFRDSAYEVSKSSASFTRIATLEFWIFFG